MLLTGPRASSDSTRLTVTQSTCLGLVPTTLAMSNQAVATSSQTSRTVEMSNLSSPRCNSAARRPFTITGRTRQDRAHTYCPAISVILRRKTRLEIWSALKAVSAHAKSAVCNCRPWLAKLTTTSASSLSVGPIASMLAFLWRPHQLVNALACQELIWFWNGCTHKDSRQTTWEKTALPPPINETCDYNDRMKDWR